MSHFTLSSREDWVKHWGKHDLIKAIPENYSFHAEIKSIASKIAPGGTTIELGGFPGSFSVYLSKYYALNVTIIDYLIDREVVDNLAQANELTPGEIKSIEANVFSYRPSETYDMVCSFGFVEHFSCLDDVLIAHNKFLKPNGWLLFSIPNFRGVNGWIQRIFDPSNLAIHNLNVMDIVLLKDTVSKLGMTDIQVGYHPSTQIWLEGLRDRNFVVRVVVRVVNRLVAILAQICGAKNRWFSNSIVVVAQKPRGQ